MVACVLQGSHSIIEHFLYPAQVNPDSVSVSPPTATPWLVYLRVFCELQANFLNDQEYLATVQAVSDFFTDSDMAYGDESAGTRPLCPSEYVPGGRYISLEAAP